MSNTFYSILPAISAAICSIILFLRIKRNSVLSVQSLFLHYAFAFCIIALTSIPTFLINLGVEVSFNDLYKIYAFDIFVLFISYLLFFRGTVLLFTKERFFPTILPMLVLPAVSAFSIVALFFLHFSSIIIYTAFAWGFLFVNSNFLCSIFIFSFLTGYPIKIIKRKFCAFLLTLGWFSILGLDIFLWVNAALYDPEFWILKIVSFKGWFFARAIVYLIILICTLHLGRCFQRKEIQEKQ